MYVGYNFTSYIELENLSFIFPNFSYIFFHKLDKY